MTTDYRIARPEEMTAILYAQSLGFGMSTAAAEIEQSVKSARLGPDKRLCGFVDGEPVSQIIIVPTVMFWNGREIASAGVTDVFTHPGHRRQGHLRELMTRALAQMRDAGQSVTILEASMAAIYQRFGWAVVYTNQMHDFDPRHLRFVDEIPVEGRVRLVPSDRARAVIEPAYLGYAAERTLAFRRGDYEWSRELRLPPAQGEPSLVAVYEEAGETLGYAIYRAGRLDGGKPTEPDQRLTVSEWVWLTPAAHRGLITFLAGHDLVGSVRMWGIPPDDPLFFQVQEPRQLNTRAFDGALARIVDVQTALEGRGYDGAGRVRIGLEDWYAPWNSGVWELTVDGGGATVGQVSADADLRMTPRVLAILASGYQRASTLARAGLIEVAEPRSLAVADALFATKRTPLCLDHWM